MKAEYTCAGKTVENEWEVYAFPEVELKNPSGVKVVDDISKEDLLKAMANGESVVLFAA